MSQCHGNTKDVGGPDSENSSSSTLTSWEARLSLSPFSSSLLGLRRKSEAKGGGRQQSSLSAKYPFKPDPVQNIFGSNPDRPAFQNSLYQGGNAPSRSGLFGQHHGHNGSYIGRHQVRPIYFSELFSEKKHAFPTSTFRLNQSTMH